MNVEHLPHYWASLPSDSPLKAEYAQPAAAQAQYLWVAAVVVVGVFAIASGSVMGGLLVLLVGGGWGAVMYRQVEDAASKRARWSSSLICLACTGQWVP